MSDHHDTITAPHERHNTMSTTMSTRTVDLAQAAHNLRVAATNYAHDAAHVPEHAADSLAALEAAALRYAEARAEVSR